MVALGVFQFWGSPLLQPLPDAGRGAIPPSSLDRDRLVGKGLGVRSVLAATCPVGGLSPVQACPEGGPEGNGVKLR
jgi:hypothetical protein